MSKFGSEFRMVRHGGYEFTFADEGAARRAEEERRLREMIAIHPSPVRYARLAELHLVDGEPREAQRVCEDGLRKYPDYPALHEINGVVMMSVGQLEGAVNLFKRAIELDEFAYSARLNLGDLYLRLGRPVDAAEVAEQILRFLPGDTVATNLKRRADEAAGGHAADV